jgi:hypothetical protein
VAVNGVPRKDKTPLALEWPTAEIRLKIEKVGS